MRISSAGGVQPQWSDDGRELFYLALDSQLVAVPIDTSSERQPLAIGKATPLFRARLGAVHDIALRQYSLTRDAQRFLLDTVVEEVVAPITVILNWQPAGS